VAVEAPVVLFRLCVHVWHGEKSIGETIKAKGQHFWEISPSHQGNTEHIGVSLFP